jgi:hypothetical protein
MKLIRINFREKPAERLELREVYDKGTLVNLMIMPCGKSVSVKVSSEDSWLTVSKEAFTMEKGGQAVMIGVTVAPGPRDEEARCESALHFHCAADGGAEEDVRFEIVAHYMKYSSSDASPRYHSSLKGWEEGGQEPPGQNGFHCSDCGAPIPDKRPFCALCRKKRSQESREEQQVSTIDAAAERIAEKVPLFNILAIISVALICIVVFISLSAPAKVQDVNGPSIAALQGEGALSITTDPPGAEVVFLSNEIEPSKTPLSLPSVKAGVYRLKLEKEGCAGTGTVCTVVVKPGCKNSYSFSLTRLGKIYAQSIPPGLDITLDGKAQSVKTPALLTALPAGEHELLLSGAIKGNEFRRSYTVDVKWNETSQIFALNDTRLSGLHVSSQEGTRIYVDGALRGTVPCEPCLFKPGGHAVSLVRKGYSSWRSGMSFQAGEVAELSVELPALAQLVLDGEPGAALYLNDRYKGALPQKMTCEPGKKNRFSVTAGDGREWKREIALLPGEYRHITVELPPPAPAPAPAAAPAAFSGPESSEYTAFPAAFYGFDINSRFPQKEWKVEERIFRDIDGDGEPEMLLAVVNKRKKKRGEGPVCLFAVKPGGGYCDVMPMRPPGRQEIGFGELYSLSTTNYDDLGYREVVYVCGDRRGNVTSQGAFIIYRGNLRNPTWMSRKIQ